MTQSRSWREKLALLGAWLVSASCVLYLIGIGLSYFAFGLDTNARVYTDFAGFSLAALGLGFAAFDIGMRRWIFVVLSVVALYLWFSNIAWEVQTH